MTTWDPDRLAGLDAEGEMTVAGHRPDGTLRTPRIVWHVVVDDRLWIRSVRGTSGGWYLPGRAEHRGRPHRGRRRHHRGHLHARRLA
jgi:hypothetical protein